MEYLRNVFNTLFGAGGEEPDRDEGENVSEDQSVNGKRAHKKVDYQRLDKGEEVRVRGNANRKKRSSGSPSPKPKKATTPSPKKRATPSPKKRAAPSDTPNATPSARKKIKGADWSDTVKTKPAPKASVATTTASDKGKWTINWSRDQATSCFVQDKDGTWYEVKLVDVISKADPRSELITPELIMEKRGLKAKALAPAEFKVVEGDWVRVHFQGWNATHDEWILFSRGSILCTKERGSCYCSRHKSGLGASKPAAASAKKAKTTPKKSTSSPRKPSTTPRRSKSEA